MSYSGSPQPSAVVHSTHTPQRHAGDVEGEIQRSTWFDFAALLLFLVGIFNAIDGIAAISDSRYLSNSHLFANLHAWGWFFLCWGVLQMVAAFAVFREATWGIVIAIATVFVNAISQLSNSRDNTVWSLTIVAIDVLIMYGLIVHRRPSS
jgi:hypothetical protein